MKTISEAVKRLLNHATPGLKKAQLGDLIEDLQKRLEAAEQEIETLKNAGGGA